MSRFDQKLERLFAKVRTLTPERQELALEALAEIAGESIYELSDDERKVLQPALDRARRGESASDAEASDLLDKPWS